MRKFRINPDDKNRRQQEYEERVVADCITDALETALIQRGLRRSSIQYWYERIGRLAGIKDLIPMTWEDREWFRIQEQFQLKERIRTRLKHFDYSPVPIPEPPKEEPARKFKWIKKLLHI